MRRIAALAAVLLLLSPAAFAGKKGGGSSGGGKKGSSSKGGLGESDSGHRANDLRTLKAQIKPKDPWNDDYKKIVDKVGQPDQIEGSKIHWYALDDAKCIELMVEKSDEQVGSATLGQYDQSSEKCDSLR